MLLRAVVETPMWKLLLNFTEHSWRCSKQPGTPCWAQNSINSFALKWLLFSLELKAAVASALSVWTTGKSSVRLFLWFLKMTFWEISPMSCHLIQVCHSYSLGILAFFWRMACFWCRLQLKEAHLTEDVGRPFSWKGAMLLHLPLALVISNSQYFGSKFMLRFYLLWSM